MLVLKRLAALAATVTPGLLIGGAALAGSGQPSPWQMGFQQAATPAAGMRLKNKRIIVKGTPY